MFLKLCWIQAESVKKITAPRIQLSLISDSNVIVTFAINFVDRRGKLILNLHRIGNYGCCVKS